MSVHFSILYQRSFGSGQAATQWTDALHLASLLFAIAGAMLPVAIMASFRRLTVADVLLCALGVPVVLNSFICI
jgi:hypothetical protein